MYCFMCRGGGHGSVLYSCFLSVLLLHVSCWGMALSLLSFTFVFLEFFSSFLLLPLKIENKKMYCLMCRGGGHGSVLFLSLFVLLLPHVSCWSMAL